jgi:hypothetical protein
MGYLFASEQLPKSPDFPFIFGNAVHVAGIVDLAVKQNIKGWIQSPTVRKEEARCRYYLINKENLKEMS